ncbi:hypothetical protein NDU88_003876 [Pleurodeles waltl]|uniref:BED-type domain-containing protein n=1 Tax=Pleurodeles waltl TaxID=8319 RepID=A0AAV7M6L8_PLEWA|nr:hypothetical protein NDU88_003876 [Pleurodeles waltl]
MTREGWHGWRWKTQCIASVCRVLKLKFTASKGRRKRKGPSSGLPNPVLRSSAQKEASEVNDFEPDELTSTVGVSSTIETHLPTISVATSHTESVPEIEIKLESSDEDDEKCRRKFKGPQVLHAFEQEETEKAKANTVSHRGSRWRNNSYVEIEQSPSEMDGSLGELKDPADIHVCPLAKPPGTKGRKSISEVWLFFYPDPTDVSIANCSLCGLSMRRVKHGAYFATAPLRRHLEAKHPMEWGQRDEMNQEMVEGGRDEEEEVEGQDEGDHDPRELFLPAYAGQHQMLNAPSTSLAPMHENAVPTNDYSSESSEENEEDEGKESTGSLSTEVLPESQVEKGSERRVGRPAKSQGRGSKASAKCPRKTRDLGKAFLGISEANTINKKDRLDW